jgi:hypothetical protein
MRRLEKDPDAAGVRSMMIRQATDGASAYAALFADHADHSFSLYRFKVI